VSYDTKVKQALDICLRKNYFKGDKNETAIVMYSGGMDSVSLLWNLLEHTDQDLHVHSIHIDNSEGRCRAEAEAILKTINYMKKNQRPFEFSSSVYSWQSKYPGGKDMVLALFQAMRVASGLGKSFNIVYTGDYNIFRDEGAEAQGVLNALCTTRRVKPIWLAPFEHMTFTSVERSKGIYFSMPEELREMYWSCRKPTEVMNGFVVCGECHACERQKLMQESIQKDLTTD
jgi:7-cyano-7-deazaguanine synthase in queuosine biosynthesis